MPFKKGHTEWKKRKKVGTGTFEEKIKKAKHKIIEEATDEALKKLANSQVYKVLDNEGLTYGMIKEMALPIALKGMKETKDINLKIPKPLLGGKSNGISDNPSNGEATES